MNELPPFVLALHLPPSYGVISNSLLLQEWLSPGGFSVVVIISFHSSAHTFSRPLSTRAFIVRLLSSYHNVCMIQKSVRFHKASDMPPAKPKPSEIAAEAKRTYIPYIERKMPEAPVRSMLYPDSSQIPANIDPSSRERLRVAVIDGDPVDVALDWYQYALQNSHDSQRPSPIPVVNQANEKRAGGDWESGLMAPEECFARRSNLVHALITPFNSYGPSPSFHYPIPQRGGIYSPYVGMSNFH